MQTRQLFRHDAANKYNPQPTHKKNVFLFLPNKHRLNLQLFAPVFFAGEQLLFTTGHIFHFVYLL